jgi:hypothetical protein
MSPVIGTPVVVTPTPSTTLTSAMVFQLFPELDSSVDVSPYITTAEALAGKVLSEEGYTAAYLLQIEVYLAAHFAAVSYLRWGQEQTGASQEQKQYKVDLSLNLTVFGQQAMILDTSGKLAKLQRRLTKDGYIGTGSITWLGTTEEYEDYY